MARGQQRAGAATEAGDSDRAGDEQAAPAPGGQLSRAAGAPPGRKAVPPVRQANGEARERKLGGVQRQADVLHKMRGPRKVGQGESAAGSDLYNLIPAGTVPSREMMIQALLHTARQCERQRQYGPMRQALSEVSTLLGYLEPPKVDDAHQVPPEEERRIICEAAKGYGMIWPGGKDAAGA